MKYGSEQILPYNQEEQKGTQVKRMFDSIAGHLRSTEPYALVRYR